MDLVHSVVVMSLVLPHEVYYMLESMILESLIGLVVNF